MTVAPWMQTLSGGFVDLLDPQPDQIVATDMIVSLSRIPRFNGHSLIFWSVAAHSLLVEELARRAGASAFVRLWALLHDAHEAYMGDLTAPMKTAVNDTIDMTLGDSPGDGWVRPLRDIEQCLQRAIHAHFGIPVWHSAELDVIKLADLQALEIERAQIMSPCARPWGVLPQVTDSPRLEERDTASVVLEFSMSLEGLLIANGLPVCRDIWGHHPDKSA